MKMDIGCKMCGILLHTFCLQDAQRRIEAANPDIDAAACQLCSITRFCFSKIPELTPEILSNERDPGLAALASDAEGEDAIS